MLLAQKPLQLPVGFLGIRSVHRIIAMEHGRRLVAGELHDHRLIHPGFPHIGVKGVPEIVKPEVCRSLLFGRLLKKVVLMPLMGLPL